jgi:hypothetical protein
MKGLAINMKWPLIEERGYAILKCLRCHIDNLEIRP